MLFFPISTKNRFLRYFKKQILHFSHIFVMIKQTNHKGGHPMELLIELVMEFILEGTAELIKSKKSSRWVRIPAAILFFLLCIGIIYLFLIISFHLLHTQPLIAGIMFLFAVLFGLYLIYMIYTSYHKFQS